MSKEKVLVYYGEGKGKSTSALGHAIRAASQGKNVIIIQFLKGKNEDEVSFIRRLEPEERVEEIAHMLSGATLTEAALNNAKELLKQ